MVLNGSCLCQAVKYESSEEPQLTAVCHCLDCQKWSGGGFTSTAAVPRAAFKVVQGETKFYEAMGSSGKHRRQHFCSTCGSNLYTELDAMPDIICIKAGTLDDGKAHLEGKPVLELYCKNRVAYLADIKEAEQRQAFAE